MSEACVHIRVRYDPIRLSPNLRLNDYERRERQRNSKVAALAAYRLAGAPEWNVPVIVDVIARRARQVDDDALLSGLKWIRDQICCRDWNGDGIVPDDSAKWFSWGTVTQETAKEWKGREEVELIFRPRQEKKDETDSHGV